MPITFTGSPFVGQTRTYNGKTWVWDGYAWTGLTSAQRLRHGDLGYNANMIVNLDQFDIVDIFMGGPMLLNMSGGADGQVVRVRFTQDGDGGRAVTLGSTISLANDLPSIALSPTPGAVDYFAFTRRAASSSYDFVSFIRGF